MATQLIALQSDAELLAQIKAFVDMFDDEELFCNAVRNMRRSKREEFSGLDPHRIAQMCRELQGRLENRR